HRGWCTHDLAGLRIQSQARRQLALADAPIQRRTPTGCIEMDPVPLTGCQPRRYLRAHTERGRGGLARRTTNGEKEDAKCEQRNAPTTELVDCDGRLLGFSRLYRPRRQSRVKRARQSMRLSQRPTKAFQQPIRCIVLSRPAEPFWLMTRSAHGFPRFGRPERHFAWCLDQLVAASSSTQIAGHLTAAEEDAMKTLTRPPAVYYSLLLFPLFCLLLCPHSATAQPLTTGQVLGQVTDPSGAVVPQAKIELRDSATGASRSATADGAGQYAFAQVAPGLYSITVSASGFAKTVAPS